MKTKIPADSELRWEWLKYQLRTRGSSFVTIARDLGVSRPAVLNAKRVKYPRVERAIARKLELTPLAIWPERWNPDGTPRRDRPNMGERKHIHGGQDTKSNAIAHCQLARSA